MKRSELIDRIVYEALSWDGLDTSGVPLSEIANDVLKVIEDAGMEPPRRVWVNIYDEPYETVDGIPRVAEVTEVNTWEPEDITNEQNALAMPENSVNNLLEETDEKEEAP